MKVFKIGLEHEYPGSRYPTFTLGSNFEGFGYRAYNDGNMELALMPRASVQATINTFIKAATYLFENKFYPTRAGYWHQTNIGLHFNLSMKNKGIPFLAQEHRQFGHVSTLLTEIAHVPDNFQDRSQHKDLGPLVNDFQKFHQAYIYACNRVPYSSDIYVQGDATCGTKTRYEFKLFKSNANPYSLIKYFGFLYRLMDNLSKVTLSLDEHALKEETFKCECGCGKNRTRRVLKEDPKLLYKLATLQTLEEVYNTDSAKGFFKLIKEACPSDRSNMSKVVAECERFTAEYLGLDSFANEREQFAPIYPLPGVGKRRAA